MAPPVLALARLVRDDAGRPQPGPLALLGRRGRSTAWARGCSRAAATAARWRRWAARIADLLASCSAVVACNLPLDEARRVAHAKRPTLLLVPFGQDRYVYGSLPRVGAENALPALPDGAPDLDGMIARLAVVLGDDGPALAARLPALLPYVREHKLGAAAARAATVAAVRPPPPLGQPRPDAGAGPARPRVRACARPRRGQPRARRGGRGRGRRRRAAAAGGAARARRVTAARRGGGRLCRHPRDRPCPRSAPRSPAAVRHAARRREELGELHGAAVGRDLRDPRAGRALDALRRVEGDPAGRVGRQRGDHDLVVGVGVVRLARRDERIGSANAPTHAMPASSIRVSASASRAAARSAAAAPVRSAASSRVTSTGPCARRPARNPCSSSDVAVWFAITSNLDRQAMARLPERCRFSLQTAR